MAKQQLEFEATVSAGKLNRLFDELRNGSETVARDLNAALGGTVRKTILLETRADESGARRLVAVERERLTAVDRIISAQKKLDSVQRGSVTSLRQQVNEARQARDAVSKYVTSVGSLGQRVKQVNGEWAEANSRVSNLSRQLDVASASTFWQKVKADLNIGGLANFSNGLVQITQGFQAASIVAGQFVGSINKVVDTAAQLQQFALSFQAIGQGVAGGADALKRAERISVGLGVSLNTVEESFRQLSPVFLNTGGTIGDVDRVTEALSSRFAAFGISGDKARRVMNGVIQAFAKGKLQAEELTQQISEADPAFKTDFAGALKTAGFAVDGTTAELEQLVKAGNVTADVLRKTIPFISKSSLLFGKLGPTANTAVDALERGSVTIDQVRANLQTLNTLSLRNLASSAEPVINAFFRIQAAVTNFLSRVSESESVKTLGNILGRVAQTIARLVESFLTLAEGALKVVDAISPLINAVLKIPAAMEIAGLAILGKFLKPLKLLEKQRASVLSAQRGLVNGLQAIWSGSTQPIHEAKNAIDAFRESAKKPLTGGRVGDTSKSLAEISKNANQAGRAIDSIADKATQGIDKKISRIDKKITNLRKKIILPEPVAEPAAPARPAARGELAAQENQASNLRNQLAALQAQAAQIQPTGISKITDETIEFGRVFNRVSGLLDRGVAGFVAYKSTAQGAAEAIGRSTLVVRRLIDEGGQGIGKTYRIDPKFLADIQRLSATDPAKAIRLLQVSLRGLQAESKFAAQSLQNADEKTKQLFKASLREGAAEVKTAIAGISTEAQNINIKKLIELDHQQDSVRQELNRTENAISELRAELEAPLKDKLSSEVARQQAEIRKELEKTQEKRQKLLSKKEGISREKIQKKREFVGFDPSQIKESQRGLDQYISAYREAKITEQLGSDPIASDFKTKIQEAKKQLDDFTAKANETQASIRAAIPVIGARETTSLLPPALVQEIDQARTSLSNLQDQYGQYQSQTRSAIASATDFSSVLGDLSRSKSSGAQRLKALGQANDFFKFSIQSNIDKIKEQQKSLGSLIRERSKLRKTGAGKGFAGQGFTPEDAGRLKELNNQIGGSRARLRELQAAQGPLASASKAVSTSLKTVAANATLAGRAGSLGSVAFKGFRAALGQLRGGLGNVAGGIRGLVFGLGPLQALLLAIGTVSRLYADGNREAAAASKEFADQTDLLKKAIEDISPGAKVSEESTSALSRAWEALAVATVGIVDQLAGVVNSLVGSFERMIQPLRDATSGLGDFIAKASLAAGAAILGGSIGAVFGPLGIAFGAALGLAAGSATALALASDQASVSLEKFKKKSKEVVASVKEQAPVIAKLVEELKGLSEADGSIKPENISKFSNGFDQLTNAINLQKKSLEELETGLNQNEKAYQGNLNKLDELRAKLKEAEDARNKLSTGQPARFSRGESVDPEVEKAAGRVAGLRSQIAKLEEKTIKLGDANGETAEQIAELRNEITRTTAEQDALAKAQGRATSEQKNLLNTTSKLSEEIKKLGDSTGSLDFTSVKGREEFDRITGRAQDLQSVLDGINKTTYEIKIESQKLDKEIVDAQLTIDLEPGPIREVKQLSNSIKTDINIAAQQFERSSNAYKQAAKEGSISQTEASRGIELAAREFLAKTRSGAASIIEAARGFRDQLKDAQNSLSNLKLSNPQFFTPGELNQNAREIESRFAQALAKVRKETGNTSFFPRLEGQTPDEILASKQRFVEVRGEADDLNKTIRNISSSLEIAVGLLAKIAGVELDSIKKGGADIDKILSAAAGDTEKIERQTRQVGEVYGTITANGQEFVLFLNNATGQTETLTRAQFEAKRRADDLAASGKKAGQNIASAANNAKQEIQGLGTAAAGAGTKIADSVKEASDKAVGSVSRVGEVTGTITANGETMVMYFDRLTGANETVSKATFDRLKSEKLVTKEYDKQSGKLKALGEYLSGDGSAQPVAGGGAGEIPSLVGPRDSYVAGPGGFTMLLPPGVMDEAVAEAKNIGREVGGNFQAAVQEITARRLDNPLFGPTSILLNAKADINTYKDAVAQLNQAKQNAAEAENAHKMAVHANVGGVEDAANRVKAANAAVAEAEEAVRQSESPYARAVEDLKEYNIALDSVPHDPGPILVYADNVGSMADQYNRASEEVKKFSDASQGIEKTGFEDKAEQFSDEAGQGATELSNASAAAGTTAKNLQNGAKAANDISDSVQRLDGLNVDVNVNYSGAPPRWTGGPVSAGMQYQVNELGQEGFLSASGRLSSINRPRNALWRAPSSGTVIPADIWANMNIPTAEVRANKPTSGGLSSGGGLTKIARAIQSGLAVGSRNESVNELAAIQAHQAIQIGKLGRAVNDLVSKDWNVNVKVRNTAAGAFLEALNHRM